MNNKEEINDYEEVFLDILNSLDRDYVIFKITEYINALKFNPDKEPFVKLWNIYCYETNTDDFIYRNNRTTINNYFEGDPSKVLEEIIPNFTVEEGHNIYKLRDFYCKLNPLRSLDNMKFSIMDIKPLVNAILINPSKFKHIIDLKVLWEMS